MGRLTGGINGPIIGKVGTVIGSTWKGKPYVKAINGKGVKTKRGKYEKAYQSDFSILHYWLKPIIEFVRAGFEGYSNEVHAFNAAKSLALKNAFRGEPGNRVLDPALIQLSWGDLPLPEDITVTKTGEFELTFSWEADVKISDTNPCDQVMMLAYSPDKQASFYTVTGQFRKAGSDQLTIPQHHPGIYHIYFAFRAHDRSRQSVSVYLGTVELGKEI